MDRQIKQTAYMDHYSKCSNVCQRKHFPTVAPLSLPEKVGDLKFMLMNGCTHWQRI